MGPAKAGKTTLIERFTDAMRNRHCDHFSNIMNHPLDLSSNHGQIRFNLLDIPSDIDKGILKNILFTIDGIVVLFDLESTDPFPDVRSIREYIKSTDYLAPKPLVLCGNKVDKFSGSVRATVRATVAARFAKAENFDFYYELCAIANHRITEPFVFLARRLLGQDYLRLTSLPSTADPVMIVPNLEEQVQVEASILAILTGENNSISYSPTYQSKCLQEARDTLHNFSGDDDECV